MKVSEWREISDFIEFAGLSAEDIRLSQKAWGVVRPHMRAILEEFYATRIVNNASLSIPAFDSSALITKQLDYWDDLFAGSLDTVYIAQTRRIAIRHREFQVPMAYYILSYLWFLNAFERVLETRMTDPDHLRHTLASVRKLVFIDLNLAGSAYQATLVD
ncbi:protoglobin domain-containing protein [Polymorphum gilvum]|uniref:Methyl-accepting chemotaxis sensory transducer n=1 Tax=Polymorphum gilvum (strain LMG 25793 / CGMCC 1.9160 / SL003B-26A1) TaxID=991905 RepID=F2IW89_POLGS|nr:protoglobin domain-containing protein [Polymorphum gilvum]ADZ71474.1 Methyl-accepting chemotaxis sensory transducer [Polymorphum gilvum SL003B-26A1]